eukprot:COSAG02_NODE_3525_length_6615_cov_2.025629_3_plen_279_part_00
MVITTMGFMIFEIGEVQDRMNIVLTLLLTSIAFRYLVSESDRFGCPKNHNVTVLEHYIFACNMQLVGFACYCPTVALLPEPPSALSNSTLGADIDRGELESAFFTANLSWWLFLHTLAAVKVSTLRTNQMLALKGLPRLPTNSAEPVPTEDVPTEDDLMMGITGHKFIMALPIEAVSAGAALSWFTTLITIGVVLIIHRVELVQILDQNEGKAKAFWPPLGPFVLAVCYFYYMLLHYSHETVHKLSALCGRSTVAWILSTVLYMCLTLAYTYVLAAFH